MYYQNIADASIHYFVITIYSLLKHQYEEHIYIYIYIFLY